MVESFDDSLRESERKLATLLSNLPGMAYRCRNDAAWTMEFVSEGAFGLTGYHAEDLVENGKVGYADLIHPADRQSVWDTVQLCLARREPFVMEYRLIHADGRERWVWEQGQGVFDSDELRWLEGFIIDITERKKAEAGMREQELLHRAILDSSPDDITITDLDGRVILASPMACTMFGYESDSDIIGRNVIDFIAPQQHQAVIEDFDRLFRGETSGPGEYLGQRRDGTLFDIEVNGEIIRENNKKPTRMVFIVRDATSRKKAEAELMESNQRFQGAFDYSSIGMALVSIEGKWLKVNPKLCSIVGYTEEEMLRMSFQEMSHPDELEGDLKLAQQLLDGTIPSFNLEKRYFHKNGLTIWVRISVSLVRENAGSPLYFVAQIEDISDKKEVELAAMKSREMMTFLAQYGGKDANTDFFHSLAEYLAFTLEADYVCIDRLEGDGLNARTVAVWHDGAFEDNVSYALRETPCGEVVGKTVCCFPSDVTRLFPNDEVLRDLGAESYVGTTLWGHQGKPIGLIAVIRRKVLDNQKIAEDLLKLVSVRAAGELERLDAETELKAINERLRISEASLNQAQSLARLGSWSWDIETGEITWSDEMYRIFQIDKDSVTGRLGDAISKRVHPDDMHLLAPSNADFALDNKSIEYRILLPDSSIRYISAGSGQRFYNPEGRLVRLTGVAQDITDRVHEENKRKQREDSYRLITERSNDLIYVIAFKPSFHFEYVSPSAERITGYTPEEHYADPMLGFKLIHPDDRHKLESMQDGRIDEAINEYRWVKKDGTVIWTESQNIPLYNEEGELVAIQGRATDITHRKRSDEELLKLYLAVEQSPGMTFITDIAGNVEYVNPKVLEVTGFNREELVGGNPRIFGSGETSPEAFQVMWDTISAGREWKGEFRNRKKSGELFWVSAAISPVFDQQGRITHFLAVQEDITERKQAEEQMRLQNDRLNAIVRAMPDLIFIIGRDGTYHEFYSSRPESLVVSIDSIIGNNISKIFGDEAARLHLEKISECLDSETLVNYEYSIPVLPAPSIFEARMVPLGTDRVLTFVRDISERKQAEEEIRKLNADLELGIERRTAELQQTNLSLQMEIEERKRVEAALSAREKSYSDVVENVREVIFQTDATGKVTFLNRAWEQISGLSIAESTGIVFLELVHPDERKLSEDLFHSLVNGTAPYFRTTVRYRTKDRGYRWAEVFASAGKNDAGEFAGTFGTIRDVTERKRDEELDDELMRLSLQLTGIGGSETGEALDLALSRIGSFMMADRAYIFEYGSDSGMWRFTHEWVIEGDLPAILEIPEVPSSAVGHLLDKFSKGENWIVRDPKLLAGNLAEEGSRMIVQGIRSRIVLPINIENSLVGFVGLDYKNREKDPDASELMFLSVWSNMLASLINNQRKEGLLHQTRYNYETFFNTIDDFLFVLDIEGNIIHTNDTVTKRLGYSMDELDGRSVLMVHPGERREEAGKIVGEMLAGTAEFCPVPLISKDGHYIPVETRVKQGYWNGKPALFGVSKDISKIQLSEEKFSRAFRSNSALMAISDFQEGKFIDVNDAFLDALGYRRDEVIGRTSSELGLFRNPEVRMSILAKLDAGDSAREFEVEVNRRDGSVITGLFSAELIYVGKDACFLTMMVDITSRKRAEEEARLARIEAEQANQAKSEFLSRMSHELRTPLNSILGFSQLLEMGELSPAQKKGVGNILASGRHLLNLINEVLDISSIEAGRLQLNPEPVQIGMLIRELLEAVEPLGHKLNLSFGLVESPANDVFIRIDNKRIRQVLLNLLHNAIKYNRQDGSVTAAVTMISDPGPGHGTLRISIRDTGIGIAEENIPKLFRPFERIGAEKLATEGSGLGLAVVKRLVDAMGGAISLDSEPGKGTEIRIDFPCSGNVSLDARISAPVSSPELEGSGKRGLILCVEDDHQNIELVKQIIGGYMPGVTLLFTASGREAIPLAAENQPDLILLDLNLPDLHGREVLSKLKENELTRNIPVVLVSAEVMSGQAENLLAAGAEKLVAKPIEVYEFIMVIEEFLKHSHE